MFVGGVLLEVFFEVGASGAGDVAGVQDLDDHIGAVEDCFVCVCVCVCVSVWVDEMRREGLGGERHACIHTHTHTHAHIPL